MPDEKSIVFMGTPDFAVPALSALVEKGFRVTAVVTNPDKPRGRSGKPAPSPEKEAALSFDLPVLQPEKVRDPEFIEKLRSLAPDLIVVAAFGQIIPRVILELPEYGCLNIHGSLLPKYRGAAPIQHAVIDGEKYSGVTLMKMGTGLDTGDMIAKARIPLDSDETGGSLFEKLSHLGAKLLVDTLPAVFDGTAVYEKQPEESPTPYASMITKEMGLLSFEKGAAELERLVRGLSPWPGAYTFLNGKTLKIWKSRAEEALPEAAVKEETSPGSVVLADDSGIYVTCKEGFLVLTEVQLEGKKRLDTAAFLRGCKIKDKTVLGF